MQDPRFGAIHALRVPTAGSEKEVKEDDDKDDDYDANTSVVFVLSAHVEQGHRRVGGVREAVKANG
jgi:hypothetical protein